MACGSLLRRSLPSLMSVSEKRPPARVIREDRFLPIPTSEHAVDRTGIFNTRLSWHAPNATDGDDHCQCLFPRADPHRGFPPRAGTKGTRCSPAGRTAVQRRAGQGQKHSLGPGGAEKHRRHDLTMHPAHSEDLGPSLGNNANSQVHRPEPDTVPPPRAQVRKCAGKTG